ncbi:MAG TPA: FecR domain-containing protein, partial [Spirochaetota bacterium]|nr:FecR domain-containing protein [Spirochaetota bacterium]
MKRYSFILIISVSLAFFINACSKEQPKQITGVLTFIAGNAALNGKPVAVGTEVKKGDRIETKENSCAVIQFFNSSLITLHEKTSINIETLLARSTSNGKNEIAIYQDKGTTFSKIMKNEASFSTRSKTTIAAVRGTAYTFVVDGKAENADIRLLHGKVDVLPCGTDSAIKPDSLIDGEKIIATGNGKKQKKTSLSSNETTKLSALDTINILPSDKIIKGGYKPEEVVPDNARAILLETDEDKVVYRHIHSQERIFNTHVTYDTNKTVPVKIKASRSTGTEATSTNKIPVTQKQSDTRSNAEKGVRPAVPSPGKASIGAADSKQEPHAITNSDLANKYGKLSTIYTNDGKEYVGVFRQSGN